MAFKYANLHIINGLGATDGDPDRTGTTHVNGLGNVIIGYNRSRGVDDGGDTQDLRMGSHNLIVRDRQNYSSYGGAVSGFFNDITGIYANVSGSLENTASGRSSSVGGGTENVASGLHASVGVGKHNQAIREDFSVSGGQFNTANNFCVSIAGGFTVVNSTSSGFAAGGLYSSNPGPGTFHSL